jgi:transcriptional regulator with XRE-family HTH domain
MIKFSGDKLSRWAEKNGLRPHELSRLLGLERQHLWRIMTSRNRPGWPTLLKIMQLTNGQVTPNDFGLPLINELDEPIQAKQAKRAIA